MPENHSKVCLSAISWVHNCSSHFPLCLQYVLRELRHHLWLPSERKIESESNPYSGSLEWTQGKLVQQIFGVTAASLSAKTCRDPPKQFWWSWTHFPIWLCEVKSRERRVTVKGSPYSNKQRGISWCSSINSGVEMWGHCSSRPCYEWFLPFVIWITQLFSKTILSQC